MSKYRRYSFKRINMPISAVVREKNWIECSISFSYTSPRISIFMALVYVQGMQVNFKLL